MDQALVCEVMNPTPHIIEVDANLTEAAKIMQTYECGVLPVLDGEAVVGMVTDRDMVVYALALDKDPRQTCVGDIMNAQVYSCYEDDTLEHAADILAEQEVRRLVVLSRQETLVGVVSMADMIKCTSHDAVNDNVVHHLFRYA